VNKLRARALEYSKATPWQKVADSLVTKYYTDWRSLRRSLTGRAAVDGGPMPLGLTAAHELTLIARGARARWRSLRSIMNT
jgi:hypothetical protein